MTLVARKKKQEVAKQLEDCLQIIQTDLQYTDGTIQTIMANQRMVVPIRYLRTVSVDAIIHDQGCDNFVSQATNNLMFISIAKRLKTFQCQQTHPETMTMEPRNCHK